MPGLKIAVLVPDGAADRPLESLQGRTPLEAARTPNMDAIAESGALSTAATVPPGMAPGSDVANLALMGLLAKVTEREQAGRTVYRVRLGPYDRKDDADAAAPPCSWTRAPWNPTMTNGPTCRALVGFRLGKYRDWLRGWDR